MSQTTTTNNNNANHIDHNVGILGIEVYTSHQYILQSELEQHENVSSGKFTIGLGQQGIAVTGDREDINSICLTVTHNLLQKYNINAKDVGRLEVGTETLVDKSKSTKTVLMELFAESDNTDIEGATIVNACYGGTAALFNAFTWVDSNGWDGRYAIVVAGDIATYSKGPARPTGGMGAVALLIGRDAPLKVDLRCRTTHASHTWDFYKPNPSKEYPEVDGALSQICYYEALEDVYERFCDKMEALLEYETFDAREENHYFVFHSPYNKLVQKSFGRLFFMDARRRLAKNKSTEDDKDLKEWLSKPIKETYTDKNLEKVLKAKSSKHFVEKMADANYAGQWIGNTYTASVFFGLASLVDRLGGGDDNSDNKKLSPGKAIVMFSYGSGALASMYQLQVREPTSPEHNKKFSFQTLSSNLQLTQRLLSRQKINANELDLALHTRSIMHEKGAPYQPVYPTFGRLLPGTYYLKNMDEQWRRYYERVPLDGPVPPATSESEEDREPLAPPSVLALNENGELIVNQGEDKRRQYE